MKALHLTSILLFALSCPAQQPAQASSSPMQVSPDEALEHLQNRVVPQYPEIGISNRIQNNELLDIVIDEQGQVVDAKVKMGHPAFAKASLDAVKQWKYRPFMLNDAPVRVATTVYILYRLAGQEGGSQPVENVPVSVTSIGKHDGQLGDPSRLRLDRETLEGRRTKFVEPKYPPMARVASIKGEVVLAVVIDKGGHVASARAVSGHPILVQTALDAVKQWTYSPYLVNGEPVAVESTVKVSFGVGQETTNHDIRDVVKEDCQRLVEGQLVFAPAATMRQGKPNLVSARLSRGTDTKITSGLDGKGVIIENTKVSCMVSMTLDSQEPSAFKIENIPGGRKDDQILLQNTYTQWDWRVTPVKSGTLHLLLYVTPMLYVDGVGQGLKQFPQPPRIITVSPDRVYAVEHFVFGNWTVWGMILTAIILPLFIWGVKRFEGWRDKKTLAKKVAGFGKP